MNLSIIIFLYHKISFYQILKMVRPGTQTKKAFWNFFVKFVAAISELYFEDDAIR